MRVGPKAGSCGTAAYRREAVNISDIRRDPLWEDYRELAAANGFRSCWSTPILSYRGDVLGTFAMYSKDVRERTEAEAHLVDVTTRIAGIAIERKLAEERIHFMANHDSLTGLPNRTLLKDRLSQAILYAQRYGRGVSVVFIDLDNFKFVNDFLGHNAGDELLTIIAERMVDSVRAADTVVRLGGDEFVILILDQPNSDIVCETVEKLKTVIAETVQVKGHDFKVTASIGVATYPNDGTDADSLLANADAAMYRAKETGRDNFQFYTQSLNKEANQKFQLQTDLRLAIGRGEFILLYQPQVELRTGRVFAVERGIVRHHGAARAVHRGGMIRIRWQLSKAARTRRQHRSRRASIDDQLHRRVIDRCRNQDVALREPHRQVLSAMRSKCQSLLHSVFIAEEEGAVGLAAMASRTSTQQGIATVSFRT